MKHLFKFTGHSLPALVCMFNKVCSSALRQGKRAGMFMILLCAIHFVQAQSVTKVMGGSCVGDNMVFAFGGPNCSVNWIIQTGISYTIVSSSNTQLTIKFNQPVGAPAIVITANYYACSNGAAGGANSAPFGVNGVSSAGSINGNQSVCYGGDPSILTNNVSPSAVGHSYQWQLSTDGGSTWSNISGATSSSYDPPSGLTTTTQYRRRAVGCNQTLNTTPVTVTVITIPPAPTGLTENGISYNAFNAVWNAAACASYYEVMISRDNSWGNGNDCGAFTNYDTDYSFQSAYWLTDCSESLQDGERYYWRVRACNSFGCSSWSTDYIDLPSARRRASIYAETSPNVYPNPVREGVLKVTGAEASTVSYRVVDPAGLPVQSGTFQSEEGLNISTLPGGTYILHYEVSGVKKTERVYKE